jgi:transposase
VTSDKLFEAALGIGAASHIVGTNLGAANRLPKIRVDFAVGSRFAVPGEAGEHPAHDTVKKC